ncbi:MAG: AraC family ligand binding domain-containing protein, partial [Clostridia bacterium]|nr:AraC family ligand binding domain-containing protein [Clostridia bacterium]
MSRWKWLIDNAKLDIYEFSVDRREQFSVEDRLFPFYVMSYVKEGSARAIISGETYNTPAGHLLLIPSFARHSHYIPEGC